MKEENTQSKWQIMKNMSRTSQKVLFFAIMVLIGAVFTLIYLAINGNSNQIYNDIVVEYTSMLSSNKSIERNLIYILCFGGIVVYSAFCYFTKNWVSLKSSTRLLENQREKELAGILIVIVGIYFFISGQVNEIAIAALLIFMIIYVVDKDIAISGFLAFILGIYVYVGLYRGYVLLLGEEQNGNVMQAIAVASLLAVIPLFFKERTKVYAKLGLVENIVIPFSLFVYLANRYKYNDQIIQVNVSRPMKFSILLIVLLFVGYALWNAVSRWRNSDNIDQSITAGSCATILAFNRYDGTGAIMPTDIHHVAENIIGYTQVFDLGRIPFKDYIPISGMYSIVEGAILDWFGDGSSYANYYVTNNFFYLIIIIGMVFILKKLLNGSQVILICLILPILSYNRVVFILPIMLLLMLPKLIDNKNLWLKAWFMTSLFHGLYYPLYGVATCMAFMPLGIWQIIAYVKSGQLKNDSKTVKFWIGWGICLLCALVCLPFLLGTLKHMLAMSSQSILADGISRFGQLVPSWFFSYLGDEHQCFRIGLYYLATFLIPPILVWIACAVSIKTGGLSVENKRIKVENPQTFLMAISVVIMPLVSFSFTVIRLDPDSIYARSEGILYVVMVMLLVISWKYISEGRLRLLIILVACTIPCIVNNVGFFSIDADSKLEACYTVSDDYVYVDHDPVEKIGIGFINQETYDNIVNAKDCFNNKDKNASYFGDPSCFIYYYLLDIKGDGTLEIGTAKGYSAAQEAVDTVRANHSIVGLSFSPYMDYYFYHWLLSSGEYYWDSEYEEFLPNDGKYTREEILEQNKNTTFVYSDVDLWKTASSWGSSMESLNSIFAEKDLGYSTSTDGNGSILVFDEAIDGDDADFIYLEFEGMKQNYNYVLTDLLSDIGQNPDSLSKYLMKKNYNPGMTVQIWYLDESGESHTMCAKMSEGKLLFPIGAATKWLFNEHEFISIHVFQDGTEIDIPEITNVRFLKIREVS